VALLSRVTPVAQNELTHEVVIGRFEIPANNVGPGTSIYAFKATGALQFPDSQTITVNVRIGDSEDNPSGRKIMSTGDFTTTTETVADGRLYSIDGTVYIGQGGGGTAMGFINESASSSSHPAGRMSGAYPCGGTIDNLTVTSKIYIVITTKFTNRDSRNHANVQNGFLEKVD
jgi:hypothetical protein